jgi:hypothetical protein
MYLMYLMHRVIKTDNVADRVDTGQFYRAGPSGSRPRIFKRSRKSVIL